MSLPMSPMRLKRDMQPEQKALLEFCPWDYLQLFAFCKAFQMRYQGFWHRVDHGIVQALIRGMLVTELFTCREDFAITSREIRATCKLCEWILKVDFDE